MEINKNLINKNLDNKIFNYKKTWDITRHYLLYPNPYPKSKQFTKRFHGHPIFPSLLNISKKIILRSNWDIYINEFELAAKIYAKNKNIKINIIKNNINQKHQYLSLFEKKYIENNIFPAELIIDFI